MAKAPKIVTPNETKVVAPAPKPAGRIGNLGDFAHPPKKKGKPK